MSEANARVELMEAILERAADALGDLGAPVMKQFYAQYPQARASFEAHGLGDPVRLEASMIDSMLYCIMYWLERPMEICLILADQVPHHCETLHVELDWFRGLVHAMIDVLEATIPAADEQARALCSFIRAGLDESTDQAAAAIRRRN